MGAIAKKRKASAIPTEIRLTDALLTLIDSFQSRYDDFKKIVEQNIKNEDLYKVITELEVCNRCRYGVIPLFAICLFWIPT